MEALPGEILHSFVAEHYSHFMFDFLKISCSLIICFRTFMCSCFCAMICMHLLPNTAYIAVFASNDFALFVFYHVLTIVHYLSYACV